MVRGQRIRRWVSVLVAAGVGASLLTGCVELREPYEPLEVELEAAPGVETIWDGDEYGLPGYRFVIPAGAVDAPQVFSLEITSTFSSPSTSQGYELVATAVTILPLDYVFQSPARLEIPIVDKDIRARVLWTVDQDHLRNSFWDYAETSTDSNNYVVEVYLSGAYWPVRALRSSPLIEDTTNLQECLLPEDPVFESMEFPQSNGECVFDEDCVVSGCSNQICGPKAVATVCEPRLAVCADCRCLGNTCRWIK